MNLLLIYANGGSANQFAPVAEHIKKHYDKKFKIFIPELSGFENREIPESDDYFRVFFDDIYRCIEGHTTEPWIVYGYQTGASLLLEFAARGWEFPNGYFLRPHSTILHDCFGGQFLGTRLKSKLMRISLYRSLTRSWLTANLSRERQEQNLFSQPELIPEDIRLKFFQDIRECHAYPLIYDMLTPQWYAQARSTAWHQRFKIVFSENSNHHTPKYEMAWHKDFPKSDIRTLTGWTDYYMLTHPEEFVKQLLLSQP